MATAQNLWQKTKTGGKAGFDKVWGWADKLGAPVNRLSNRLGSEAFWPTTLDKESDKAARILRSFCSRDIRCAPKKDDTNSKTEDGFYEEEVVQTAEGPKKKQKVLKKIPSEVIRNAKGLAIFTVMRTGLWISGAGGSGVLVGRLPDGSWSPPSGILLHTAGLGFLVGVDIYDCVVVINTQEALDAFSKIRCTLGGEITATAGPLGMGGVVDTEVHKRRSPIFTYLKSRGFYAGVQVDGTIVIERTDENERFYHSKIPVADILAGKIRHPPYEINTLMQTIKAAQGDTDVDPDLIATGLAPGDYELTDGTPFGVPDKDDPDPYGVLALEREGMQIREAGTKVRPSMEQFQFNPTPTSPVFNAFHRDSISIDGKNGSRRSSWRTSQQSHMTDRSTQTVEAATQTEFDTPGTSPEMAELPEGEVAAVGVPRVPPALPPRNKPAPVQEELAADEEHEADDEDEEEEDAEVVELDQPVVHAVRQVSSPQIINKPRMVTVQKPRAPPALPPRNPIRDRKNPLIIGADPSNEDGTRDAQASPLSEASSHPAMSSSERMVSEKVDSNGSISSVEPMGAMNDKFTEVDLHAPRESPEQEKEDNFHSIPTTPSAEPADPIHP